MISRKYKKLVKDGYQLCVCVRVGASHLNNNGSKEEVQIKNEWNSEFERYYIVYMYIPICVKYFTLKQLQ